MPSSGSLGEGWRRMGGLSFLGHSRPMSSLLICAPHAAWTKAEHAVLGHLRNSSESFPRPVQWPSKWRPKRFPWDVDRK